jgi:hypothetical protein
MCGYEVAESAYNYVSGSGYVYGVTDLNYNPCTALVVGSVGSYIAGCVTTTGKGCGTASVNVSNYTDASCVFDSTGATGCNTSPALNDSGYTAYASGYINTGNNVIASAVTGSY